MTTHRRHDLLAAALLLVLPTLFFGDVLFGDNNFYLRDLTRFHYPMKQILREVVQHGEFPYWNRTFSGGQPLAANPQHEVFYPPNWLIFLPSYDLGFRLQILLHIYIALLGMYALLRSMELAVIASLLGAISWGMGGLLLSCVNVLPTLYCAAWIPLTCLYARKFLLQRRGRDFALASLFLGLQLLVGEPTTLFQTGVLLGMYALYRAWYSENRGAATARNVFSVAMICVAAGALAAVQVIPMIDHARGSIRAQRFAFDVVGQWSMPPVKIVELIFPNLLGHASINNLPWYWGGALYPGVGLPFLLDIYCGLAIAALAVGGLAARLRGSRLFAILFVLSVGMALGGYTPFLRWLYDAGIINTLRYPEKFILMGVFAMIVFGAYALDHALAGERRVTEAAAGSALATGIFAGAICLLGFTPWSVDGFLAAFGLAPSAGAMLMIARAWSDWSVAGVRALALLVLLLTMHTRRRALWSIAAVIFVCADLAGVVDELNPRMPRRFFTDVPELAKALPQDRSAYRIYHDADWQADHSIANQFFRSGLPAYWASRNGLFPVMTAGYGISTVMDRDFDKSGLLPSTEFGRAVSDVRQSGKPGWWRPLMAMSNAWYRTVYNDYGDEESRAGGDVTEIAPVAFAEEEHQPRYYFADQIVRVSDRHDFASKMIHQTFSRNVAFIGAEPFNPARGIVHAVRESANGAAIDVESFGRGFLVMSVTPHKYWRVTIDGQRTKAVVANIAFQGVAVPPGRHRVAMQYRNDLIPISAAISIFAAAALVAVARKRRAA